MNIRYDNEVETSSETRKYIDRVKKMFGEPSGLEKCIVAGLPLYPIDPQTKCPYWRYTQQPGIKDLPTLDRYIEKYTAFATVPAKAKMLAIDVDRKRGRNGIRELQKYYEEEGADISELSPAPRVMSPGNGLHLYFRFSGPEPLNNEILKGVEVKHSNLITAPGSTDHRGEYELTGNLEQAPPLPVTLRRLLVFRDQVRPWIPRQPVRDLALEEMVKILNQQGHTFTEGGRNRWIYKLALFCAKRAKPIEQVFKYCEQYTAPDFSWFEIQATIKSAYRTASRGNR